MAKNNELIRVAKKAADEWRNTDAYYQAARIIDMLVEELESNTLTQPNEPERAGLYGKYTVYKNKDGSLVPDCFVLRPAKDPAAVIALRAYAAATDNAELSADIINQVGAEPNEPLTCDGCISLGTSYGPCMNCIRSRLRGDMYRRPPEEIGEKCPTYLQCKECGKND